MTSKFTPLGTERLSPETDRNPDVMPAAGASPATPAKAPLKAPLAEPLTQEQIVRLKDRVVALLHTVFDPEIPVNIYELGLIYAVDVQAEAGCRLLRSHLPGGDGNDKNDESLQHAGHGCS